MAQAMQGSATDSSPEATLLSESQAKLPTRQGWSQPLVLYRNYWFLHRRFATDMMRLQKSFKPRHDDTILAANPKCGTTWIKALAFTITNRSQYEFANHPLLSRHPHEVVPYVEMPLDGDQHASVEMLPSPRLVATHMPLSLFPKSIASCGCRLVYVCREPKDAFVSMWHFQNNICKDRDIDLETAFSMFSQGCSPYGPFWDHCLEYWKESVTSPDKVLFLKYEDMISEPVKHVTRLAGFLGVPFSTKEEEDRVPEEVVRLCSFERLSSLHNNKTGDLVQRGNIVIDKSVFFRKGKVGDWVNHMSEEMGRKLDCIVEEKLKGTGLVL